MRFTHKLGKDIGISPIHLKEKYSNKEIDQVLYNINDVLYFFNTLYINSKARQYIMDKLVEYGNDLNNINNFTVGDKKIERKKELLKKMRELYSSLKSNYIFDDEYFNNLVEKMGKYRLSRFIKDKQNGLTDEQIWKYIRENKIFYEVYGQDKSVKSIQDELLKQYIF